MLRFVRHSVNVLARTQHYTTGPDAKHTVSRIPKDTGTIAAIFTSLSGKEASQLPPRFSDLKKSLWKDALVESWRQVLKELHERVIIIADRGTEVRSPCNPRRSIIPFLAADNTPSRIQRPQGWSIRCPNCAHKTSWNRFS